MKRLMVLISGGLLATSASVTPAAEAVSVTTLARNPGNGGITVHENGDLYIGEFGNFRDSQTGTRVFRVKPDGRSSVFVDGLGISNSGNDFDAEGNLIQSAYDSGIVRRVSPDRTVTDIASLPGPVGVVATEEGDIFVASCLASGGSIYRIAPDGTAGVHARHFGFLCPNGLTRGPDGTLYSINFQDGKVFRIAPDGSVSQLADLGSPGAHIVFGHGELYATARRANAVFRVTLDGEVERLAGSGIPGEADGAPLEAQFSVPNGIAISNDGRFLYVNGSSQAQVPGGGSDNPIRVIELDAAESVMPMTINYGHSGSWYNAATDGQGFSIEVVVAADTGEPSQVVAYWFTFAKGSPGGVNRQRWFQAVGPIEGGEAVLEVYQVTGGVFDDPAAAESVVIGTATIHFTSCTAGQLEYELDLDGDGTPETTGSIPLERLTPDVVCGELSGEAA